MEKEVWCIYYHHSFYGDVVEGTFADAVRAGIKRVEEDFGNKPLVVRTGYGYPGTKDYREEIQHFETPLDVIAEIELYDESKFQEEE